jgi:DNA-binding CsgD family transcriptional regulator
MLLGRAAECAVLDELLAGARAGHSGVLVLRGEPGIGKTTLLQYATDRAHGMQVLSARGFETESEIPFAGLADLLRPVLPLMDSLPGPQAAALRSALALGPALAGDRFSVCAATLSMLAAAAERGPVLAVIDDLPWLDASSREAILFAARRLQAEAVAVVMATRAGDPNGDAHVGLRELTVKGLTRSAADQLSRGLAPGAPQEFRERLFEVTAGNPLGILELGSRWDSEAIDFELACTAHAPGLRLNQALSSRLGQLPDRTRDALLVVAASGGGQTDIVLRAVQLRGSGLADFAPAEVAGLVTVGERRVEFRHPLLRSVLYHSASTHARCEAHVGMADALAEIPGDAAADARAWHLAAATLAPDEEVGRLLEEAAVRARRRAGYVAAARAFEKSARFSPAGARARLLLSASRCWQLAGRSQLIQPLLEEALPLAGDPVLRAMIQHMRSYVQMWREPPSQALHQLVTEAEAVEDIDPQRAALMYADAGIPYFMLGQPKEALAVAQRAYAVGRPVGGVAELVATVALACGLAMRGRRAEAARLLQGCHQELLEVSPLARAQELAHAAYTWVWLGGYREAGQLLDRVVAEARRVSALGVLPQALGIASELHYRTGRWSDARACAAESIRLAEEAKQANLYGLFFLARMDAVQGPAEECRQLSRRALDKARRHGAECMSLYVGHTLGLLALGAGRNDEAIEHLERVRRLPVAAELLEPAVVPWAFDLVEAYARSGRGAEAAAFLARIQPDADDVAQPWAQAVAGRCRALLSPREEMVEVFEQALSWHARIDMPFERARTWLCLGERLRRARQRAPAREHLRAALEIFEQLGAEPWVERARAELAATGETAVRGPGMASRLTPQELQVALVVARGASNQEAASALFLSQKTIEYHLSNIYRKANIQSRAELPSLAATVA